MIFKTRNKSIVISLSLFATVGIAMDDSEILTDRGAGKGTCMHSPGINQLRGPYQRTAVFAGTQKINLRNSIGADDTIVPYKSIKFSEKGFQGNPLTADEKISNNFLEDFVNSAGVYPGEFYNTLLSQIESNYENPNDYYKMIYNCAKSLRHTTKIDGGNKSKRSETGIALYDLDLLDASERLLNIGLYSNHTYDWGYQLGQTQMHKKELRKVLHDDEKARNAPGFKDHQPSSPTKLSFRKQKFEAEAKKVADAKQAQLSALLHEKLNEATRVDDAKAEALAIQENLLREKVLESMRASKAKAEAKRVDDAKAEALAIQENEIKKRLAALMEKRNADKS